MGWLDTLNPVKGLVEGIRSLAGLFIKDPQARMEFEAKLAELADKESQRHTDALLKELEAKERILVAELQQDDNYTKRARPTVVYAGLGLLLVNNVILPWITFFGGQAPPGIELPAEFYWGWSGIVATYAVGRSFEKRAQTNGTSPSRLVSLITGAK